MVGIMHELELLLNDIIIDLNDDNETSNETDLNNSTTFLNITYEYEDLENEDKFSSYDYKEDLGNEKASASANIKNTLLDIFKKPFEYFQLIFP